MTDHERDLELVRRVVGGDAPAFDELMKHLDPELESFLKGQLRTAPDISVDEVQQEVRIYLFQRLDRYDPSYPLGAFARGLARNVAKRFLHGRRDLLPATREEGEDQDRTDLSPLELGKLPLAFRQVMGEGRFDGPEGAPPPSRVFLELMEVFLRYGGYPHQQITFGHSILLWGKEKRRTGAARKPGAAEKVPVTGDPDRVVREVGPRELRAGADRMLEDLASSCRLDAGYLGRARLPLDERLDMTGADLFARDPASAERYPDLHDREIGDTRLLEYFGKDPRRSVSDWTHGVKNRVKKAFLDPASRSRLPLPEAAGTPREV